MKAFNHVNAKTLDEASKLLSRGETSVIAGGTDLLGTLKDDILPMYPKTVVNIKTIPGLDYIKEENGTLKIGANTRIADIANSAVISEKYTALAQAAKAVSTPNLREMSTIGGNLSQLPRCWYFRKADNRFECIRKGGTECFAMQGDNRYHSVLGGAKVSATPCQQECPAATDIPSYQAQIRKGNWDAAARIIMQVNPLPALTGRVCAHFCQNKCNQCSAGDSVNINGVERTLGDYILENTEKFYPAPAKETGKSVAIVGGGPAGLSAAYYLRKAGNKVTVYDVKDEPGGMLMYAIPAYRLPKEIVRKVIKALEGMGIVFKTNQKIGETVLPEELEKQYDSVCYSTGTWKRPVAGLSGEELTTFGLDFLTDVKKWMDGKLGSEVFVMGGGNVAMDVAVTAKRLGAEKVTMACLETRDIMPASKEEIARAEEEGIVIYPGWGMSKVVEENGIVKGMELQKCVKLYDENGRFSPTYDPDDKMVINAGNILMAIGQSVDLSFLDEKYQVKLSARGLIDIDDASQTSRPGIFAAGDATTGPGTVIRAIDKGHTAARGMLKYLGVEENLANEAPTYLKSDPEGILGTKALVLKEVSLSERKLEVEDAFTASLEEATTEARRCLTCSCYAVHASDIAPALIALDAKIVTNSRTLDAEDFFTVKIPGSTVAAIDELVTEIQIPSPKAGEKSAFIKFAFRKSIDFPVVNAAVKVGGDAPRVALNAVSPKPYRALKAEAALAGKAIDEAVAETAGAAAISELAQPFEATKYKIQIVKTMVKRALLATVDKG
ncbi:MAG: FAD-dependent oxidoreductase [Oscillospiraceae bacterium]|jgi:NADPH-dependent glutamate synthase beta subunit-like oxidoreductase|nr:FAD-dependent oxidoreductase [Oscillospiraceae bacterium]